MQNIDDYIKKSVEYAVIKMGGYPGDALRIYKSLITQEGFNKNIRQRPITPAKPIRVNPVRSLKRLVLTQDEKKVFDIIYSHTDFPYEELISESRKRDLVDVRKQGMVLFAIYLNYTYKKAGDLFGHRDHSTVIHAVNSHDDLIQSSHSYGSSFKKLLDDVKKELPHYFERQPLVTLKQLKNEFDQVKWERFASKWAKEQRDMKQLREIKEALIEYDRTKTS